MYCIFVSLLYVFLSISNFFSFCPYNFSTSFSTFLFLCPCICFLLHLYFCFLFLLLISHFLFSCFLFPFYPSSPDTYFPMNSLDGYDVSFFGVSMCSHPMMNTLNILNVFPCSGFVKKYASIEYVGQYSMLNSSLLTLYLTGKYLIGMCR